MIKKVVLVLVFSLSVFANDIIIKNSSCSVDKTIENLKLIFYSKGLKVFTVVDHNDNAQSVNMKMGKSKLIIFGNPKLGTSLMQEDMTVGLDLPMKILVYEDENQEVKMAFRNASWLINEHDLSISRKEERINTGMHKITKKAGTCTKD